MGLEFVTPLKKLDFIKEWMKPPTHYWYQGEMHGFSLSISCDRSSSTATARLASGHINSLKQGSATFGMRVDLLNINVALFSYTRAFGDGPRNFEPWSSDVDDT
ncbi:hypothetical protein TNCV_3934461 [Trichonephila clavipes]|nr:hypothetical protein TNCV_3934461 [Trichonephila clavipes]